MRIDSKALVTLALSVVGAVFSLSAFSQAPELSVGSASGDANDTVQVSIDWESDGSLSGIGAQITYDDSVLTVSATGTTVDGCLSNLAEPHASGTFTSCETPSAGTINLNVNDDAGTAELVTQNIGSLTFTIAGGAAPGSYPISVNVLDATNTSGGTADPSSVNTVDGNVSVSAGPSEVDFTPNPGSTIDFGSAEQNTGSSTDSVQICNVGGTGSVINVTNVAITSGSAQFSQDGACDGAALEAGGSDCCTVGLTFAPDGTGTFNGSLAIDTDAESGEGTNGDATFSLTGEGTLGPAPSLDITPASHDYGGVDTGLTSTQVFTVTNNGQAGSNAELTAFAATGGEFSVIAGGTTCTVGQNLGQGDSCDIEVEFAPTSAGEQTGQLEVDADDTENGVAMATETAALQGTGNGPIFSSNPGPGTHTLGTVPPGGSLNMDVVITNDGNEPLDATCGSLTDPDGVFTLTPDPANFTGIAAGASETFNVACDVPDVATYEATLQCSTNEDGAPTYDYTFRCSGQPLVIPTMQPWGLILLSLMMLAIGGFSIRFFRAG